MDGIDEQAAAMAVATVEATAQAPAAPAVLDEERLAWLALAMTPGLGPKRILDAVKETRAYGADTNGTGASGADTNGTGANGTGASGADTNGTGANGTGASGADTNGTGANGTGTNGTTNGTGRGGAHAGETGSKAASSASRVLELPLTELEALNMPASAAQFIFEGKARAAAAAEWERVAAQGATIVSYGCREYPERLREIYDPPPVLWVRGDARLLARPGIAVVGTRHPTPYGSGMAELLARDLAARRLLIISGMARGIDTAAHKGALAARTPTLAVWGTGIDVVYPKENRKLAEEILATGGAIVSEVPMGTFPAPQNFPRRNRILSGLSVAVLVVEAAENSGTRVTARCAEDQNRDLYAVPGNVTNKGSWTPNTLIKQGAKLVATWEDVWEDLPSQVRLELEAYQNPGSDSGGRAASKPGAQASLIADPVLRPEEALVLEVLHSDESLQMDEILELLDTQLTSSEVFTALFELEMAGRIRSLPGKHYVRTL